VQQNWKSFAVMMASKKRMTNKGCKPHALPYRSRWSSLALAAWWPAAAATVVIVTRSFSTESVTVDAVTMKAPSDGTCHAILRHLRNPALLSPRLATTTTNGSSSSSAGAAFAVRDPSDPNAVLARVPRQDADDAKRCIQHAQQALSDWRDGTTAAERGRRLQEWSRLMREHAHDLATIVTLESGKPVRESRAEVSYARSFLDYYAAEAVRPNGFLVPTPFADPTTGQPRGQIVAMQQAVGVTALITPWNFPLAMVGTEVGMVAFLAILFLSLQRTCLAHCLLFSFFVALALSL
jgi:Aldehyde dehydrogenase family